MKIRSGYKLRKKVIKGKPYAYEQKGSDLHYLGLWTSDHDQLLEPQSEKLEPQSDKNDESGDYGDSIRKLAKAAQEDALALIPYSKETLRHINPSLDSKLRILCGINYDSRLEYGVKKFGGYDDEMKRSVVLGTKPKPINDFLEDLFQKIFEDGIRQGWAERSPSLPIESACYDCGGTLIFDDATNRLLCRDCSAHGECICPVCEIAMEFNPRFDISLVSCKRCSLRTRFEKPPISTSYAVELHQSGGQDPRLEGIQLVVHDYNNNTYTVVRKF